MQSNETMLGTKITKSTSRFCTFWLYKSRGGLIFTMFVHSLHLLTYGILKGLDKDTHVDVTAICPLHVGFSPWQQVGRVSVSSRSNG